MESPLAVVKLIEGLDEYDNRLVVLEVAVEAVAHEADGEFVTVETGIDFGFMGLVDVLRVLLAVSL